MKLINKTIANIAAWIHGMVLGYRYSAHDLSTQGAVVIAICSAVLLVEAIYG